MNIFLYLLPDEPKILPLYQHFRHEVESMSYLLSVEKDNKERGEAREGEGTKEDAKKMEQEVPESQLDNPVHLWIRLVKFYHSLTLFYPVNLSLYLRASIERTTVGTFKSFFHIGYVYKYCVCVCVDVHTSLTPHIMDVSVCARRYVFCVCVGVDSLPRTGLRLIWV